MLPSISVVTPSFNQGRFLEKTIQSVLAQNIIGLEYMIVDGGSTDQTMRILRKFEGSLRWVSERDEGQADAVNKGINATKGDIIGWINSDDIYYPGALSVVQAFFMKHDEIDVLYGEGNHIDGEGRVIERYPTLPWSFEHLKRRCFLCQPAVFFRRKVLDRHGFLNPRLQYCLDYEFWLRLARHGARFCQIRKILAATRLHPETKTLGVRMRVIDETLAMLRDQLGRVPEDWLLSYARVVLNRKGIRRLGGGRMDAAPRKTLKSTFGESPITTLFASAYLAPWTVFIALYGSFRWNGRITPDLLRILARWITGHGDVLIKRCIGISSDPEI